MFDYIYNFIKAFSKLITYIYFLFNTNDNDMIVNLYENF